MKKLAILCFEDFIVHRLGVEPAISFSLAGRTMMFEVKKEKWSEEILSLAGIDPARRLVLFLPGKWWER